MPIYGYAGTDYLGLGGIDMPMAASGNDYLNNLAPQTDGGGVDGGIGADTMVGGGDVNTTSTIPATW